MAEPRTGDVGSSYPAVVKARILVVSLIAALLPLIGAVSPADAVAPRFKSCGALHKVYPNGVAKTRKTARKAYAGGARRPHVSRSAYVANRRLDRDGDRIACERPRPLPPPPIDPWLHLDPTLMLPLEVMDFSTGTSLRVSGFEVSFDRDESYVVEKPQLSPAATVTGWDGEYFTNPQLVTGTTYTMTLQVDAPGHWSCSVYNPKGCSWRTATTDVMVWRFTPSGQSGVIQQATKVSWDRLYRPSPTDPK